MFISGLTSVATYFAANSYGSLVCYVIVYGFLDGSFIGLMSLVTLDITGIKYFAQGYGLTLAFIGVPIALGPPIVGKFSSLLIFSRNSFK